MITIKNLEEGHPEYSKEIKPKIEEFNNRKESFNLKDLRNRVAEINDPRYPSNDKNALFLGIGDLVEEVQKSKYYSLFVDYVKERGHRIFTHPFIFKDDFSKIIQMEYYIPWNANFRFWSVFSILAIKEGVSGATITLLEGEKDEGGLRIRLPDFSEIMSRVQIED